MLGKELILDNPEEQRRNFNNWSNAAQYRNNQIYILNNGEQGRY